MKSLEQQPNFNQETNPAESTNKKQNAIPPQYKGMPSEIVEELWQNPVYADEEKNKSETERRQTALDEIRREEQKEDALKQQYASLSEGQNRQQSHEGIEGKDYEEFKVKNGETDIGVYWYEYGNTAAKKLKESGKLKWGKERIYFDIPLGNMKELRDLAFELAKNEKIPIAFKHLDTQKTSQIDLKPGSETTRFVANFASVEDAKRFYQALQQRKEYKNMKSDRNLDYHGYNLDGVAHYASGYREKREPLKRIVETAQKNPDNTYGYYSADGSKKIMITKEQYDNFTDQFNSMPDPEKIWKNTNI